MGVYQPLLWGLNLLLLCASTAMLYLGSVLVNFYLLPSLWLFSENFATVPHLIIAIGVMLFFFSIFGFVAAASKNRILLAVYAGLMGVVFLLQLASIFTSIDFRNELDVERVLTFQHKEVDDDMAAYWTDPEVKERWDTLQRDFQCCGAGGGQGWHTGYKSWERAVTLSQTGWGSNTGTGKRGHGVPTSCCLMEENCQQENDSIFKDLHPERTIYVHGCMTVLGRRLRRDVLPLLLAYIGCGVLVALVQILSLVLASAYAAAISRKNKHPDNRGGQYAPPLLQQTKPGPHFSDTLYSGTADSGRGSRTGSLRSNNPSLRLEPAPTRFESPMLESAPPRTPASVHRSSMFVEPSQESGTVI